MLKIILDPQIKKVLELSGKMTQRQTGKQVSKNKSNSERA